MTAKRVTYYIVRHALPTTEVEDEISEAGGLDAKAFGEAHLAATPHLQFSMYNATELLVTGTTAAAICAGPVKMPRDRDNLFELGLRFLEGAELPPVGSFDRKELLLRYLVERNPRLIERAGQDIATFVRETHPRYKGEDHLVLGVSAFPKIEFAYAHFKSIPADQILMVPLCSYLQGLELVVDSTRSGKVQQVLVRYRGIGGFERMPKEKIFGGK